MKASSLDARPRLLCMAARCGAHGLEGRARGRRGVDAPSMLADGRCCLRGTLTTTRPVITEHADGCTARGLDLIKGDACGPCAPQGVLPPAPVAQWPPVIVRARERECCGALERHVASWSALWLCMMVSVCCLLLMLAVAVYVCV